MYTLTMATLLLGTPFMLGGIQVNEPDHGVWVDALKNAGMNTVATTVYARQADWDGANLWYEDEEPAVISEIKAAKQNGLHVVLVLRVALDHAYPRNRFLWHGMVAPRDEATLTEWFRRYGRFAEKWARRAQELGVDVLAVGSEMSYLTNTIAVDEVPALESYYARPEAQKIQDAELLEHAAKIRSHHIAQLGGHPHETLEAVLEARRKVKTAWARTVTFGGDLDKLNHRRSRLEGAWRKVIADVRKHYRGPLTYAANFDQYEQVAFWDALDQVGINAYFQLRHDPDVPQADLPDTLEAGWRTVLGGVRDFLDERDLKTHPVIFTELGYLRRRGTTAQPWASGGPTVIGPPDRRRLVVWSEAPTDLNERAIAVEALHKANATTLKERFRGLLYWKLSTEVEHVLIEPFVHIVGDPRDPLGQAFRNFAGAPGPAAEDPRL